MLSRLILMSPWTSFWFMAVNAEMAWIILSLASSDSFSNSFSSFPINRWNNLVFFQNLWEKYSKMFQYDQMCLVGFIPLKPTKMNYLKHANICIYCINCILLPCSWKISLAAVQERRCRRTTSSSSWYCPWLFLGQDFSIMVEMSFQNFQVKVKLSNSLISDLVCKCKIKGNLLHLF